MCGKHGVFNKFLAWGNKNRRREAPVFRQRSMLPGSDRSEKHFVAVSSPACFSMSGIFAFGLLPFQLFAFDLNDSSKLQAPHGFNNDAHQQS